MRFAVRRVGNWVAFSRLQKNLTRELYKAYEQCLRRWALKAEGIAKMHISTQDLAGSYWAPLSPYTVLKKALAGNSPNTLVETSAYFQSITSWVSMANGAAYVGVKRTAKYPKGTKSGYSSIAEVAKIQEYGSLAAGIPARPLWQPTFEETMKWHIQFNMPGRLFLNAIRQRYS